MLWLAGSLLLAVALAPFLREALRPPVDAVMQAEAPGEFAALEDGATHYLWDGPEGGPVVVLIHGLTTPSFVWDAAVPGLAGLGFRVLRYDLWGRGYSDMPVRDQTPELFVSQLDGLLAVLGVRDRVSLIGYSMGACIAAAFAARDPDRVDYLGLVAPATQRYAPRRFDRIMRDWPVFGDWLMRGLGVARLVRQAREDRAVSAVPDFRARLLAAMRRRGYGPAVLSSLRHTLDGSYDEELARIARASVPVGVVWGGQDLVIPIAASEALEELNPEAIQLVVDEAGHGLPHTHPEAVVQMFAEVSDDFL
jgi:pimeloyl-ACP methyl ester carboxylesterase